MGLHRVVVMIYRVKVFAEAIPKAVGPPRRAKSGHVSVTAVGPGGQRAWWFAKAGAKAEAGQVVATFTPRQRGPGHNTVARG